MITNNLPTWLDAGKDIHDPRLLWDWIKFNIRSNSIIFSKQIASIRRKQEEELNKRYQEAVLMFHTNPCNNTRLALEKSKQDLEALYEDKVEGIILRARARWHEHGEKNSKYFLNLEKRNHVKKHVRKLHISGVISTDPFMIMDSQRKFYKNLYRSRNVNLDNAESSIFFDSPNLPSISHDSRIICEGRITAEECQNVLKTFPTAKTPGNDGLPIEFYNTFWPLLSDTLINSFNEAFMKKEMSPSQRQAVITLIEKQDKDRTYLENWRPISLTNVDAKIASKVIATRIVKVLPEIIHSNQTGYVSGRYIGEAARSILDIMDYTKTYEIPGLLLFIDFEKAFDSLEWNFMFKCLEVFGFGSSLTRWIETFYSNITSCIINNGTLSASFEINRGVRQGDPLSPYLFIIAMELLAVAIRSCSEIDGIKIDEKEFKMVQYADDLTAFVSDIRSAQYLFKLLDQFQKCSGLKVNYTKTEAMWIGSSRNNIETPLALKWRKTVKALGVHFSYNNEESVQKNFYDKLKGIKSQIRLWSWRGLSLFGKVTIIKSLLLPKVLYISSILPSPLEFIKALQSIIYNFLWKGPDKIARTAVINDVEFGGLKVTDFTTSIMSLRLSWIGRFLSDNFYPWKAYLLHLLKPFGGEFFLHCDYNINDYNISPIFYKEMLHWWSDFRSKFDLVSLRETIIWNNHNIRVNGKPLFYYNYNSANIILLSDLKFDLSNTESFNLAKRNGLKDSNFLTWTGVRCAVPSHLRIRCHEIKKDHVRSLQFKIGDKIFDPALSKSRDFYGLLISSKATESRGFTKLKSKFSIDDVETKKAFSLIRSCICETYVQCFQFKILNDILFTNSRLAKIGLIQSDLCTFCNTSAETIDHLFFYCVYSHAFWEEFESYWIAIAKEQRKLELKTILIGVTDTNCSLFNYLIVLGKLHLWNCRRNNSLPFFPSYKELVKRKYETECHIAAKFNDRKMLEAKWKPILNYNLIDT